jgi:hypothetical protein
MHATFLSIAIPARQSHLLIPAAVDNVSPASCSPYTKEGYGCHEVDGWVMSASLGHG